MKTALIAIALSATVMTGAFAAPVGEQDETVQIKAPAASYQLANGEFDEYAYSYMLENGKRIKFTQRVARYYAQLEGEKKAELLPQSEGVFVTANGARIQFRDDGDTVSIGNYEKLAVNSKLPANTIMLAKR